MREPETLLRTTNRQTFPPLPRFSNRCENKKKRRVNEPTKFDTNDTLLAHTATFHQKTSVTISVEF